MGACGRVTPEARTALAATGWSRRKDGRYRHPKYGTKPVERAVAQARLLYDLLRRA